MILSNVRFFCKVSRYIDNDNYLANPTPLLWILASLKIRVEITVPYGVSIASKSLSVIKGARLAM